MSRHVHPVFARASAHLVHLGRMAALVALCLVIVQAPTPDAMAAAHAATLSVCPSGCAYAHIQDAINAASSGDTISIGAGTYAEHLDIEKNLTLLGAGAQTTVIDGSGSGRAVTVGLSNAAADVTLAGVTIRHGNVRAGAGGFGGGLYTAGKLTLTNSTVRDNTAATYGGGIDNDAGTLTLTADTISGNTAPWGGGIYSTGPLTLTNSTISGNTGSSDTGGGGGISNGGPTPTNGGPLTLTNSTVSGNTTAGVGGGIWNYSGRLTLTNSTVSGNTCSSVSGSGGGSGGGINNYIGMVTLSNSTVSGNSCSYNGAFGGGIDDYSGSLTLTNSTVSGNTTSGRGGGISIWRGASVTSKTTILAGNTAASGPDCSGSLASGGYNLIQDPSGCVVDTSGTTITDTTTITGQSPQLGPLQDNGGSTWTMAPQPGSPAIDAVPASQCALASDQRGYSRPDEAADNGACDIGAIEYGAAAPPSTPTSTPSATPTSPPTATPTTSNGGCGGSLKQVVACDEPSVVRVDAQVSDSEVQGSAFVVRSDSTGTYLLTNRHVIEGATPDQTRLIAPDGKTTYRVLAILANDAKSGSAGDLAVIKIRPTSLRPLSFADMANVAAGDPVASIGYGMAFQLAGPPSVTEGIISAVGRDLGDGFGPVWIQHQSTINPGNSGGPLLDMDGHVVGVNTLSIDQPASGQSTQDMFFAIPANLAQSTAARLIAQLQNPTTTLLRATQLRASQPRASHFKTAYYTLTLPGGWISSRLGRNQPDLISRDQFVQVQPNTTATHRRPSPSGLRQIISRLAHRLGRVKDLTFNAVTVGHLPGVSGTATYAHKPYRLVVMALPDRSGRHVFVLDTIVHSKATARDMRQYDAVVASLRPTR